MSTSVTLNPSVTNVTVSNTDAISVDLTTSSTTVELTNGVIIPQSLGTGDSPTFAGLSVGTIGTGTWQGTPIANDYIGNHSADKLTTGTIGVNRISGNYTSITGIGTLSSLAVLPPSGTTGNINHVSRGGTASFNLAGVGSVGDADYVARGNFTISNAANALILSDAITLIGATAVNGALTVNNNLFEITSTDVDRFTDPVISLFRNQSSPVTSGYLGGIGEIQFNGNDSEGNKTEYASIRGLISDKDSDTEDGVLQIFLAKAAADTNIITMFNYGVVYQPGIHQYLTGSGKLQIAANNSNSEYVALYAETPTAQRTVLLPDADGTIALTDSATAFTAGATTVNGALTVSSGITGSQTLAPTTDTSISVSEFAAFAGKKIIYTGGAGEIDLPAAVAADNGKSWVIINAGTGALTIDVDGSGTAQFVRFLTGGAVSTSNSANRIIAAGGSAELVCIADGSATNSATVPNYLIYGGGIS